MKQVITMKWVCLGEVDHEVTVRNINGKFHCRVLVNGQVNQEAVVDTRREIGKACREMLRWEDKCGNISEFASAARHRN